MSFYYLFNYLSIYIQGRVVGVVGASGGTKIDNINILIYLAAYNYLSIYIQGRVVGVVGASGGTKIISAVAQVKYFSQKVFFTIDIEVIDL